MLKNKDLETGLLQDLHLGVRNGSAAFREFHMMYLLEYALPYFHSKGITTVLSGGDVMDSRRSLLALDRHWIVNKLIPKLKEFNITIFALCGNHDSGLKDSLEVNWINWLAAESDGYIVEISKPQDLTVGDCTYAMIPWICKDNYEETLKYIENTDATIAIMHAELEGFSMGGSLCTHGTIDANLLSKFDQVLSSHFHCQSKRGNIEYLGTNFDLTWGDYEDCTIKGITTINNLTQHKTFLPNPEGMSIFKVLEYNHSDITSTKVGKKWLDKSYLEDTLHLKNKVVRIEVTDRSNSSHYKAFLNTLRLIDCVNFNVLDLTKEVETFEQDVTVEEFKLSTLEVLLDKVDLTEGINHDGVADKLKQVYSLCIDKSNLI